MKIQNTNSISGHRLKFLVYGEAGVGKTSLAATINEPTIIISSEAGLLSLAGHDIDVIDLSVADDGSEVPREDRVARLGEVFEFLCQPAQREKYRWVFIDSLTEISQNLIESLGKIYPDRKDGLVLWGEYNKKMMSLVKTFRDLPHFNVVFTALQKVEKDENARRFMAVEVNGKVGTKLPALFDEVFWMHIIEDEKGNEIRRLLTGSHENVVAKDRSGMLSEFERPHLGMIAGKIRNESEVKKPKTKNKGER